MTEELIIYTYDWVPEGPRGFAETVSVCVEHYVDCLATGTPPWVDTDLAMLTLEAITGAYRSAEEGKRIELGTPFRTRFPE